MHPSTQMLALALTTLAIGGVQGLKFHRRADPVDTSNTQGAQNLLITNAEQTLFYTPMEFGSGNGSVHIYGLVSTTRGDIILPGSHAKNLTGFIDQGKKVDEGPVYTGPVSAAGWTVPDQDIIYYDNSSAPLPIHVDGEYAYAGFGIWPNTSTIAQAFGDWSADSFVARVLAEPASGFYWTLLINPVEEDRGTDKSFGGIITIGEIANVSLMFNVSQEDIHESGFPDLTLIADYPHLNYSASHNDEYYYAVIDAISWGNGSATLNSSVPGIPDDKAPACIDSTYSWIVAPYSVTEQLYKGLENATYMEDTGLWSFKCTELTINITIAGHDYPISPLTAAQHVDGLNCVGTFQAKPDNAGGGVVLGVPFLKNVYASFSYATMRDGEVYDPYVQLMPITDIEDAHNDWETWYTKWGGSSSQPFSTPAVHPTPSSSISTPPSPSSFPHSSLVSSSSSAPNPLATGGNNKLSGAVEDDDTEEEPDSVNRHLPAIIAGSILGGLVLVGGIVFAVMRMRKGRDGKGSYRGLGKPDDGTGPVKVPVYDAESSSGRYGDGGQGRYTDPYKD